MSETETTENWTDSLPEALRDAPFIGKAESVEDAVGKLAHAATLVGTSIRIPGENASDEDRAAFYAKLQEVPGVAQLPNIEDDEAFDAFLSKMGKPDEHTGYKIPEVEGFEWDEGIAEDLRKYALASGLTQSQFKRFATQIAQQEIQANRDTNAALEEARKDLRLDWGDTLEDRENLIRGYMEKSNAPDSMKELLDNRNIDKATMNWLYGIAKQFKGEVAPLSKQGEGQPPAMTPEEARSKRAVILDQIVGMSNTDPRFRDLQNELVACSKALADVG